MVKIIKKDLMIEVDGGKYKDKHGMLKDLMPFMWYVNLNCVPGTKCIMVNLWMTFLPQEDEEILVESFRKK